MKRIEYQRLELALQAAENIAPVQFQIRYKRFSPAGFKLRLAPAFGRGVADCFRIATTGRQQYDSA